MRLSKILLVFLVLGCASINTQILDETEYIGELISQQPKTEEIPAVQPISPVVEVKPQETESVAKENATTEVKTDEATKKESVVEEEKPKESAPIEETKPAEIKAPQQEETKPVDTETVKPEVTQPAVSEENAKPTEQKTEDKSEVAPVVVEQTPEAKEQPKLEKSEFGVYGFLALVFSFSVMYMAFLIYQQNKKYDFLNHDLHDQMGYELLEDQN